jgi:hypothetical protein
MTADDAITLARQFLRRTGAHARDEVRVVDLDEELVRVEREEGQRCPDNLRVHLVGRFAVSFKVPTPSGGSLVPGGNEVVVHVTKENGEVKRIWDR